MSISEPYTINEIEALLLAQEERLEKHCFVDPLTYSTVVVVTSWIHRIQETRNNSFLSSRGGRGHYRPSSSTGSRSSSSFRSTPTQPWNAWTTACPTFPNL